MIAPSKAEVTRLLRAWEPQGHERLLELLYDELRRAAGRLMARERVEHTLQPTALVHEAWLRLVDQAAVGYVDRAHFLGIAARCMRQVLVDHARGRAAAKRGGGWGQVTLDEGLLAGGSQDLELLALDEALGRLAALDERAAQVAERRIFAGMTIEEIAEDLLVSRRTVDGDWATARLWLTRELEDR
ncbi:MAG TPA: ECF-type sigma factor [Candidatus Krumholzibacteria bacterium]|nr:ECF-type sigma factor [Candidatus Krumholzibacteria bacterium]